MAPLPAIIDPSQATGHSEYVLPLSLAAMAVGADALLIEVYPRPEKALCDGSRALKPEKFYQLMEE